MLGGYKYTNEDYSGRGGYDMSFHHNLLAHHSERAPNIQITGVCDIVNNVIYNTKWASTQLLDRTPNYVSHINVVKNYYKKGPDSAAGKYEIKTYWAKPGGDGIEVYVEGNIGWHRTSNSEPENLVVDPDCHSDVVGTRHTAPLITETSAVDAYEDVLLYSGNYQGLNCNGTWSSRRDAVDKRIIEEVKRRGGKIIDASSINDCKGVCRGAPYVLTRADYTDLGINDSLDADLWPIISSGTGCTDTDHDGMPDEYENLNGFDSSDPSDGNEDADGDGYTNIEEYLNGTDPKNVPDPTAPPVPPTGLTLIQ